MGRPDRADAEVRKLRKSGHLSEYLFAAISEAEFDQKKQKVTTVVMARTEKQ
jgi:pyruvate dehydrogenase complex dehydrogenase (E1) component